MISSEVNITKLSGCLKHYRFVNDGDIIDLEIEQIGVVSNKVIKW